MSNTSHFTAAVGVPDLNIYTCIRMRFYKGKQYKTQYY